MNGNDTTTNEQKLEVLRETALNLVKGFVRHKESVTVNLEEVKGFVSMEVVTHVAEISKAIGGGGATFVSMQTICSVIAQRMGFKFHYAVRDVPQALRVREFEPPFKAEVNWSKETILRQFYDVCALLFTENFIFEEINSKLDKDVTTIELVISEHELKYVPDIQLAEGLSRVFGAIGRAHGRKLRVTLNRKGNNDASVTDSGREIPVSGRV